MLRISGIHNSNDAEYQRIIRELSSLGIAPSGNKNIDKNKLQTAKTELVEKIQTKFERKEEEENLQVETINPVDGAEYAQKAEMEEQRLGAMTVAQLNRIYFNI